MALKHDLLQRVVVQNHSKNQWKWWSLWWLNMSNREGSSRSYSFWNRNGSKCEVSKGTATSSKKQPQKSWTTLFTTPFINHFREWAHFIYYPFINRYSTLWSKFPSFLRKRWIWEKVVQFLGRQTKRYTGKTAGTSFGASRYLALGEVEGAKEDFRKLLVPSPYQAVLKASSPTK